MILTAGLKPDQVSRGKSIILGTLVGLAIALLSWTILNVIFNALANQESEGFPWPWNEIQCTGGEVAATKPCTTDSDCGANLYCDTLSTNKCVPMSQIYCAGMDEWCIAGYHCGSNNMCTLSNIFQYITKGNCTGVGCSDTGIDTCNALSSAECSISAVNAWSSIIEINALTRSICSGIDTIRMVKAVMARESGGNINTTGPDGLSAGLMHLIISTAENFKSACNITDTITLNWLRDPANASAQICISIEYLRSLVGACGCNVADLAAGYNGGTSACAHSVNCGSCVICSDYTRAYQCFWDDDAHTQCNTGFIPTRAYVPQVTGCYDRF